MMFFCCRSEQEKLLNCSRDGTPPCYILLGHEPQYIDGELPHASSWIAEAHGATASSEPDILLESIEIRRRSPAPPSPRSPPRAGARAKLLLFHTCV